MTSPHAGTTTDLPLVAFIGESQVGKSSLVNALAGVKLLPTAGTGAPKSQAVCEWSVPATPLPDGTWRVSATWLPREVIGRVVDSRDATRARLLREGLKGDHEGALNDAVRGLADPHVELNLAAWAAGRDVSWLPLDTAQVAIQARLQVKMLTAGWPAALASCARIQSEAPASFCLVDLPGLGHDDVGGQASEAWLKAHAPQVAAIICVVGKRTPQLLEPVLQRHWPNDELHDRLHVVTTFADHLVEDPENAQDRRRASDARRHRAAAHLRSLIGGGPRCLDVLPRTFCLDPRPTSRFWRRVEFDGEMERLRLTLAAARTPPPRPPASPEAPPVAGRIPPPPAASKPRSPRPSSPPLAPQRGEDVEGWLSRVLVPTLRRGRWEIEPLRSGRQRSHLKASDSRGHMVNLITIYGTGVAYFVASTPKVCLALPTSEAVAKHMHEQLIDAARELGVAAPRPTPLPIRSAR